jgi:hypothetical protein
LDATHSLKSTGLRHFNLDYWFCLGQLRFYDTGVESHARDSIRFGESGDQLSHFVSLDTSHVFVRASLFVAHSESGG